MPQPESPTPEAIIERLIDSLQSTLANINQWPHRRKRLLNSALLDIERDYEWLNDILMTEILSKKEEDPPCQP